MLSDDQLWAAILLAGGKSRDAVCAIVGVRPRSLARWLRSPLFTRELEIQSMHKPQDVQFTLIGLLLDPARCSARDPMRTDL